MAERRPSSLPNVHLDYAFDRLLAAKLQNAYAILVPDRAHKIPPRTHVSGCVKARINGEQRSPVRAIRGAGGDSDGRVGL